MNTTPPRWVLVLGQWLLCGLTGASLCLIAALVFNGTDYLPALWEAPIFGFEWGLIGGLELGTILWLFGRASRGVRPGELILAAVCMCALPTVVNLWLHLMLWRVLDRLVPWAESSLIWESSASSYLNSGTAVVLGALGGTIAAAALWGWPRRSRRTATRNAALCALVTATVASVVFWGLFRPAREHARLASCMSNQKCLGLAFLMYANDYGDRLPPGRTSLELIGLDRAKYDRTLADPPAGDPLLAALGGGPMYGYSKNLQIWFCPSDATRSDWRGRPILHADPEPGVSYLWHASLAGQKVRTIPVPAEEWFLRDREPWHDGTRVVVFADGHAKWQRPAEPSAGG